MQQHTETIDDWVSTPPRGSEKLGFERNVDNINDRR